MLFSSVDLCSSMLAKDLFLQSKNPETVFRKHFGKLVWKPPFFCSHIPSRSATESSENKLSQTHGFSKNEKQAQDFSQL